MKKFSYLFPAAEVILIRFLDTLSLFRTNELYRSGYSIPLCASAPLRDYYISNSKTLFLNLWFFDSLAEAQGRGGIQYRISSLKVEIIQSFDTNVFVPYQVISMPIRFIPFPLCASAPLRDYYISNSKTVF
jgi:hypothetical protein